MKRKLELPPDGSEAVDQILQHISGRLQILVRLIGDIILMPIVIFGPLDKLLHRKNDKDKAETANHEAAHLLTAVLGGREMRSAWISGNDIVSAVIGLPAGAVTEMGHSINIAIIEDIRALISLNNNPPEIDFDRVEPEEMVNWLFYSMAGEAAASKKSASEFYTTHRWNGIYSAGSTDFALIANAFHHSEKYASRAQNIITCLFNLLRVFFKT